MKKVKISIAHDRKTLEIFLKNMLSTPDYWVHQSKDHKVQLNFPKLSEEEKYVLRKELINWLTERVTEVPKKLYTSIGD